MIAADEARLLDRMAIGSSPAAGATWSGSRRTRIRGSGLEFHDYRPYQPGDDPRSIDWTAEARLRQLVVRVSRAEGSARVHVLVDTSASMNIGDPGKLACARRLAAALCYVAVARHDSASLCTFDTAIRHRLAPAAGWPQLARVMSLLSTVQGAGGSALDTVLLAFGAAVRGPGLVVVLSDFFEPGQGLAGLASLQHQGLSTAVVQIVAAEELDPDVGGDTELVDVERPMAAPLVVDAAAVVEYRRRLATHCGALRELCLTHHVPWTQISASMTFRQQLTHLEQAGVLSVHG